MSQLKDEVEQQLYNGFTAESADELKSQFEKQVYNAYTAAGGGGGGSGPSPATTKPLADAGTGAVGTSLAYARADHQHPSSGGGTGDLPELTEEHVVGKLNGKPVYEIVIVSTTPSSASTEMGILDVSSLNIDILLDLSGYILGKTSGSTKFAPINYPRSSSNLGNTRISYENKVVMSVFSSNFTSMPVHLTIRYTKTTTD